MKQLLSLSILVALIVSLTSCKKDDQPSAKVNVTVKEFGLAKSGVSVHMFSDNKGPGTSFFKPFHSDKVVVTEANGVASFELKEVFDLNTIDSQTTFYFGVFDNNDQELGNTAVTIKEGETKTVNISY